METQTFDLKKINVQTGKIQTKKVQKAISNFKFETLAFIEVTNAILSGKIEERKTKYYSPMGTPEPKIYAFYTQKMTEIAEHYNWELNAKNYKNWIEKINSLFPDIQNLIPVNDKRKSETDLWNQFQERQERQEKEQKAREEQKAACMTIPENMAAITIQAKYDDSDIMTDYFSEKRYGPELVIATIPKNSRTTENICRNAIENYPELKALEWTWKKENYSMGKGYYLKSNFIGKKADGITTYGGNKNPGLWYEITVNNYSKHIIPHENFNAAKKEPDSTPINSENGIQITKNDEKNGIEIRFDGKPEREVLDYLKLHGFRWSKFQKIWYTRFNTEKMKTVSEYFNQSVS